MPPMRTLSRFETGVTMADAVVAKALAAVEAAEAERK